MYYVYFLELSNNTIYTGYTTNLKQRLQYHNSGFVLSTKPYLPVKLKSYVAVESESVAINLEKYFKSGSGRAFCKKRFW
jgi:putative endonuclease